MARPPRNEIPGTQYHVTNRGLAKRSVFETRADHRHFLAQIARAVKGKGIVLLAYALMQTHFHLLIESRGGMSEAMQRVQARYTRRFNRRRGRDGPLFKGRYYSKPVLDARYRRNVVRYIHENPVLAELVDEEESYPWSSAHTARLARVPRWLDPTVIERLRRGLRPSRKVMQARQDLMLASMRCRATAPPLALEAVEATPVKTWLQRHAELADGQDLREPLVGPTTLLSALADVLARSADRRIKVPSGRRSPVGPLLAAGLLRTVAASRYRDIAHRLKVSEGRAKYAVRTHARCLRDVEQYADLAADVTRAALRLTEDDPDDAV